MTPRRLDLGSGTVRHVEGFERVDVNPATHPDVVADLRQGIPAADESCSHIRASHFVEHLSKIEACALIRDAWRALAPGGLLEIIVPYALHDDAHGDPTHRSLWVPRSFWHFTPAARYLGYHDIETRWDLLGGAAELVDGREVRATLRKVLA